MNFCKDCCYCVPGVGETFHQQMEHAKCHHPDVSLQYVDVVSGEPRKQVVYCATARISPPMCGPDGTRFEPKPPTMRDLAL